MTNEDETDTDSETNTKDVLIRAAAQNLSHKWRATLAADHEAFWRVNGTPRQTAPGRRVWFEYGGRIYAGGEITALEDGRLWFDGAVPVDLDCPTDPPTRGFTYIEPLSNQFDSQRD